MLYPFISSSLLLDIYLFSSVFSAVVMNHQEPISMRDPKFVSVAAKVFELPRTYFYSEPRSMSKSLRNNKKEFQLNKSKLLRKGKEILFHQVKSAPPIKPRKPVGTKAQTKVLKKQVKRPKKFVKPKRRPRGSLTASDLWRLNRSSHKFTKTMGRKGREGRRVNKKVSNNLFY